jgi:hypothetical protein
MRIRKVSIMSKIMQIMFKVKPMPDYLLHKTYINLCLINLLSHKQRDRNLKQVEHNNNQYNKIPKKYNIQNTK